MKLTTLQRALMWTVAGGLVGIPLDALHVVTGVLSYRAPDLGLQAWWVLLLFPGAGLALGMLHRASAMPLARRLGEVRLMPPASTAAALAGLAACVFAYASSGALQRWPMVALAAYAGVWLALVAGTRAEARLALVLHSLGTAVIGPAVEMLISSTGAFTYAQPDVLGVAAWLPGIYLNAGAAAHLMDRRLLAG